MTKRAPKKTTKPTTKAKRATKPKAAPTVIMSSAEGIEAEIVIEEPKLTLKQEKFCQAFIESGNATEAYRQAYDAVDMKSETVNRNAHELTKSSKISTRLAQLRADALQRHQITTDRILAEYAKLAFANMQDYTRITDDGLATVDLSRITPEQAAAIQEMKVDRVRTIGGDDSDEKAYVERITFKLHDKRGALDSIAKLLGMVIEKRELTGAEGRDLFPPTSSSRDIARAVLDVLREARLEGQEPDDGEDVDYSPAVAAATAHLPVAAADMTFDETTGALD